MKQILRLHNLSKNYGRVHAVKNLSFSIEKGNVYGILGPNGSGKSTTLGMVLNVINPSSGSFEWFDSNLSTHKALKKVGAIIERPNFYPYMSAYQNLKLVCRIKEVSLNKIDEKLALVGLLDRKNDKFRTFSLGMKQRLAIASALLNDPEILILDEPTNGLDPQGIFQIRELIKKISQMGTTILLASHLLDEVEKVCTHVLILQKGIGLFAGSVDMLISSEGYFEIQAKDPEQLVKLLNEVEAIGEIKPTRSYYQAFLKSPLEVDELQKYLIDNNCVVTHLVKRKERLEEQFLELTKNQNP